MADLPIFLEAKDIAGMFLLLFFTLLTTALLLFSQRLREIALFFIVAGAVLAQKLDVNIFSADWYRGTTRGFEFSFVDVFAISLLLSTLLNPKHGGQRWFWPAGFAPMLIFTLFAAGSLFLAQPQIFGLYEASKLIRGLIFFLAAAFFIRSRRELAIVVFALACALSIQAVWAIQQRVFLGLFRTPGTLHHANSLSMYLCLVAPVLAAAANSTLSAPLRWFCWISVAGAVVAIFLTISRAGIPTFALVTAGTILWSVSWRPNLRKAATITFASLAICGLVIQSWGALTTRYQQATLEEEYLDESGGGRGYYFRQAGVILEDHPFGIGLNNWSYWVSKEYASELGLLHTDYDEYASLPPDDDILVHHHAAPAHNLGVITAAELGWIGLAIFSFVWLRWLQIGSSFLLPRNPDPMYRIGVGIFFGCIGVFLQSITEWTFRQTEIFITFHILIGILAALHYQRRIYKSTQQTQPQTIASCV